MVSNPVKQLLRITSTFLLFFITISISAQNFIQYVNPMVGTDFHGHTFPGATAPFGMVQLSPDTRLDTWDGCSGYHYSDTLIYGFSHTHLSGTGCSDYGDVLFMPVIKYSVDSLDNTIYRSPFSHSTEKASPGYYEVTLEKGGIKVQLTAGTRIGMHRYTYPSGKSPQIIIDLKHRDILIESDIRQESKNTISGYRRSKAWSEDQVVYFFIEFSKPIKKFSPYGNKGALLSFKNSSVIEAKIGISSVSAANAAENLHAEMASDEWNFNLLRQRTEKQWNDFLGKIDVTSSTNADLEQLKTFYTSLYHTAIAPNVYSDFNGEYRGMDRKIHKADGFGRYTVFSLWDTFRALHPLFTIIERGRTLDFLKTFETIYRESGKLPIWELSGYETNCMIGFNSVSVIADAMVKGIEVEDMDFMLDAMVASSRKKEFGLDVFYENGLVPADKEHESVSKTLEYAYDSWCIAQVAENLFLRTGLTKYQDIYRDYITPSLYYRNVFDRETGFMRPVLDGRKLIPFRADEVNNHFTEANSWQYSFFVPQDVQGHIALLGGDSLYCAKLDALFEASEQTTGRTQSDITGLIGQYAHGNEPSHHIAYLYSYAGQNWKTQQRVRSILDVMYTSSPDGLCGNEDCGQMSAWYVLSAIGLYSVTPGSDIFVFSTPIFNKISINLENGNRFCISSDGDDSRYIKSASLNGNPYTRSYIHFNDILNGGELSFTLSSQPEKDFGAAADDRPKSSVSAEGFIDNPWFVMDSNSFVDSLTVTLASAEPLHKIYYRKDESGEFQLYKNPIIIYDNSTLSAYSCDASGNKSFVTYTSLFKINSRMDVKLLSRYNPQYSAGGDKGLIDGKRGSVNWRTGGWQGYQDTDFEAIIDLKEISEVREISAGFCQDVRSWIWMPVRVEYSISDDGNTFVPVGTIDNSIDSQDYTIQIRDFTLDFAPIRCRYIKIHARNFGTIPDWHLGARGEAFIFIDEITVR